MQELWIWLDSRKNVGPVKAMRLLEHFQTIEELYHADERKLSQVLKQDKAAVTSLADKSLESVHAVMRECVKKQIRILTYADDAYPTRLKNIHDPPLVLYYKGKLPDFDRLAAFGIVGTRKATPYGLSTAARLGAEITQCGGLVISGLADGIDSASMMGALQAGGTSVGILGNGVDIVYPAENKALYEKVLENGCILSEYAPGTKPTRNSFPRRNRIISGLSCGVVVVEAPARSGALITAAFALEQGRDVYAVPGNVDSPASAGTLDLIRQGAAVAVDGRSIMEEYKMLYSAASATRPLDVPEPKIQMPEQKKVDKPDKKPYSDKHKAKPRMNQEEETVWSVLSEERKHVDAIIFQTGLPTSKVLSTLTILEVKGFVRRYPGKYYSLA